MTNSRRAHRLHRPLHDRDVRRDPDPAHPGGLDGLDGFDQLDDLVLADPTTAWGELLAALPHLLGFVPRRSVVAVSLHVDRAGPGPDRRGSPTALRVGLTGRVDLPDGDRGAPPPGWAQALAGPVALHRPDAVVLVAVDDGDDRAHADGLDHVDDLGRDGLVGFGGAGRPPWAAALDALADRLAPLPVAHAWHLTGDRAWCAGQEHAGQLDGVAHLPGTPCPFDGLRLSEHRHGRLVAELVLEGRAPLADRDAVADLLRPEPRAVLAAVRAAADADGRAALRDWAATGPRAADQHRRRTAELFGALARRWPAEPTVAEAARVLVGLGDVDARDEVLLQWTAFPAACDWPSAPVTEAERAGEPALDRPEPRRRPPGVRRAGGDDVPAATGLLRWLCRRADRDLLAPVATLVAADAWAHGEGALANEAVAMALDADPCYRLAGLLGELLRQALAPSWARRRPSGG